MHGMEACNGYIESLRCKLLPLCWQELFCPGEQCLAVTDSILISFLPVFVFTNKENYNGGCTKFQTSLEEHTL